MHSRIQVVILAAGRGIRLRPLTDFKPKTLLMVAGRPILEHTLDLISPIAHEIVLVIGYHGEKIWRHIGDEYHDIPVRYIEQRELGGTAHALEQARHTLDKRFLVMMGDDLYARQDIEQIVEHPWAILAKEVSEPKKFGVVRCDRSGYLKDIVENPENPTTKLANCGAYVMGEEYFQHEPVRIPNGEIGLPQTLVKVAQSGTQIKVVKASFWHPIGYPQDLERAEKLLAK
ncbi:MAG: nucleotidyltransferase family protein [bacterium]|nr:nucleotidyltransferase family protein [bacterium]